VSVYAVFYNRQTKLSVGERMKILVL